MLVVDLAVVNVDAGHQAIAKAVDGAVVNHTAEAAKIVIGIVEPLEDRVHQVPIDVERANLDGRVLAKLDRGLVGNAVGIDVALPIVDLVGRRRRARLVQRRIFCHGTGNALLDGVAVEVESRFDIRRDLVAKIGRPAHQVAVAVVAEAVLHLV